MRRGPRRAVAARFPPAVDLRACRRRRCPAPDARGGAPAAPRLSPSGARFSRRASDTRRSPSRSRDGRQDSGHGGDALTEVGQSGPTAVQPPLWPWPRRRIHVASDCATRHPVGGPECAVPGGPAMMSHSIRWSLLFAIAMVCIGLGDGNVIEGSTAAGRADRTIAVSG